jgi:DNA-directed RNA polymerase specialized sigma24 family protein
MGRDDIDPFEFFLSWLSPGRDTAEKKFNALRRRLITMLDLRGCPVSEDLVEEAILRFVRLLPSMADSFKDNDPTAYLYVTAHHLHLEYVERQFAPLPDDVAQTPQPNAEAGVEQERLHECLDRCLERIGPEGREAMLDYYRYDRQAKIDLRKALARHLGISANALRIRIFHLRNALQACIEECLGLKPPAEME